MCTPVGKKRRALCVSDTCADGSRVDYHTVSNDTVVQLVEVDRELVPERWRVFYGVYRVRQSLDLWDMEKKVFQGQAVAEARRKEIQKWLADLALAIAAIPADDKMLTFTLYVGRGVTQTHQLKPLLASLLSEVGGVEADLQELGAIVRRDRVPWVGEGD